MTEETLKFVKDRQETKVKGGKSKVKILNSLYKLQSCRDKENSYCKEIEESNRRKMRFLPEDLKIKGKFKLQTWTRNAE